MWQQNGDFLGDQINFGEFKFLKVFDLKQPLMTNPIHIAAFRTCWKHSMSP